MMASGTRRRRSFQATRTSPYCARTSRRKLRTKLGSPSNTEWAINAGGRYQALCLVSSASP
jgi:hypothetical protein